MLKNTSLCQAKGVFHPYQPRQPRDNGQAHPIGRRRNMGLAHTSLYNMPRSKAFTKAKQDRLGTGLRQGNERSKGSGPGRRKNTRYLLPFFGVYPQLFCVVHYTTETVVCLFGSIGFQPQNAILCTLTLEASLILWDLLLRWVVSDCKPAILVWIW